MRDEEKKRDFHEKKSRLKVAVALGDCVWGSYWKGEPDARGAVVGTQALKLLETQVERGVDALGVITISRGCFERCCSNKKTPPYQDLDDKKSRPDARGAVVGTQSLELLKQQVEPDLDDKRSGIQVAVGIGDCVNSR